MRIKACNGNKGRELNMKVLTLAMRLHARDEYTDVMAGDGSKKDATVIEQGVITL